jgi:hypothetical protein
MGCFQKPIHFGGTTIFDLQSSRSPDIGVRCFLPQWQILEPSNTTTVALSRSLHPETSEVSKAVI